MSPTISTKMSDVVGQFRGEGDFSEWLKKFELVLDLQGITEAEKVLPLFLTGEAFSVYDGLKEKDKKDYSELKSALTRAFSLDKFSAYEAFISRRYVCGEAIDVYLSDLRRLGRLVYSDLSEEWLKCAFIAGLPDNVKLQLKAATAADSMALSEVVERARLIFSVMEPAAGMVARTTNATRRNASGPLRGNATRHRCFVCGDTSHFARRCPRRRNLTCFECGENGHRAADCQARTSESTKNV